MQMGKFGATQSTFAKKKKKSVCGLSGRAVGQHLPLQKFLPSHRLCFPAETARENLLGLWRMKNTSTNQTCRFPTLPRQQLGAVVSSAPDLLT